MAPRSRAEAAGEPGGSGRGAVRDRPHETMAELRPVPEQVRCDQIEQGPQLVEVILDGRPGQGDPRVGRDGARGLRHLRTGVLQDLRLVEDRGAPLDPRQGRAVRAQRGVAGERHRAAVHRGQRPAAPDRGPQVRCEPRDLVCPVPHQRRGTEHQLRPLFGPSGDTADGLQRLAESHLVGQHRAAVRLDGLAQPAHPAYLIRAQLGVERRAHLGPHRGGAAEDAARVLRRRDGDTCGVGDRVRGDRQSRLAARDPRPPDVHRPAGRVEGHGHEPVRLDQHAVDVGHLEPAEVRRRDDQGDGLDVTDRRGRPHGAVGPGPQGEHVPVGQVRGLTVRPRLGEFLPGSHGVSGCPRRRLRGRSGPRPQPGGPSRPRSGCRPARAPARPRQPRACGSRAGRAAARPRRRAR